MMPRPIPADSSANLGDEAPARERGGRGRSDRGRLGSERPGSELERPGGERPGSELERPGGDRGRPGSELGRPGDGHPGGELAGRTAAVPPNRTPAVRKRRSLFGRTPQRQPETGPTKTSGGVTATPHTGTIPRISTTIPASNHPAGSGKARKALKIPGIPAQGGLHDSGQMSVSAIRAAAAAADALRARQASQAQGAAMAGSNSGRGTGAAGGAAGRGAAGSGPGAAGGGPGAAAGGTTTAPASPTPASPVPGAGIAARQLHRGSEGEFSQLPFSPNRPPRAGAPAGATSSHTTDAVNQVNHIDPPATERTGIQATPTSSVNPVNPPRSAPHTAAPTTANTKTKPARHPSLRSGGWIPDQHGAWAMALIPFWVGVALSGFTPRHLLLFALWIVGYFAFFAITLWLKARRREKYWHPVRAYGSLSVALGVATLVAAPELLEWAVVFAPLIAITLWEVAHGRERSLLERTATVFASGVMLAVAYDLGTNFQRSAALTGWLHRVNSVNLAAAPPVSPTTAAYGWMWVLIVTVNLTAYFWSTVPFVKSLVREKNSPSFLTFSIIAHLILLALAIAAAIQGWLTIWNVAVWVLIAARAIAVPLYYKLVGRRVSPRTIGFIEVAVTTAFVISIFI